jgi:universal bacterial protein YeaZ
MNILAIDTITPVLAVTAKGETGKITIAISEGGQHAEKLVDAIDRAIALAGFSARETELVTCAEGPGSFTGLRLAWSAAKAVSLAAECPLIPVAPLPCYALPFADWPGVVVSVLDAKKNRFYAQVFRRGKAVTEALDMEEKNILEYIDPSERVLVTGPDAFLFAERLNAAVPGLDVTALPSGLGGISGELAEFAENTFPGYTEGVPDHAGPIYVRKSDAESGTAGQ